MRVLWVFLLMTVCILAAAVAVSYLDFPEYGWSFYLLAGALGLNILLLIPLYRMTVKPMRSLANGVDLLRGQDFSSRLSRV